MGVLLLKLLARHRWLGIWLHCTSRHTWRSWTSKHILSSGDWMVLERHSAHRIATIGSNWNVVEELS